jgi:triacylglycerol lipase
MPDSAHYPIVLAHGIARFDVLTETLLQKINLFMWDLSRDFDRLHYFKGIASYMERHGFAVYKTNVSFAAGVEVRATELAAQIRQITAETGMEKVHIIGHSMGGLDARQMLFQDRKTVNHVATVTSIGTPHNGTVLADYLLADAGEAFIESLRPIIDLDGFLTLTRDRRQAFNELAKEWEAKNPVSYRVYAGFQEFEKILELLKTSYQLIYHQDGENDGLVPVTSQLWTDKLVASDRTVKHIPQNQFPVPADHFNEIGWWDLAELSGTRWWKLNLRREKKAFETAVKEAYLQIAQEVTTAVPPT